MRPILVVGTGRSGTSFVAKELIDLGVCMGERFREEDENNPGGVWEDLDFRELSDKVITNKIKLPEWKEQVQKVINTREGLWGFKDPNSANLLPELIEILNPRFVWARRDLEESIESCVRCYNMDRYHASVLIHYRDSMCNKYLKSQDTFEVWCGKLDKDKLKSWVFKEKA